MKYKEFIEWKNDLYKPPKVLDDGSIEGDKTKKFYLTEKSKSNEENSTEISEPIIAVSLPEALYCAAYLILIKNMPEQKDLEKAVTENNNEYKNILVDLIDFTNLSAELILTETDSIKCTGIAINFNENRYELTSETYDFSSVYKVIIDNNIIKIWEKINNRTMVCAIPYNILSTSLNKKILINENQLSDLINMVMHSIYSHRQYMNMGYGYSSISEEDDKTSPIYSINERNKFAEILSYKRAIADKMKIDSVVLKQKLNALKTQEKIIHDAIKRENRSMQKINRRIKQTREFIKSHINDIYKN